MSGRTRVRDEKTGIALDNLKTETARELSVQTNPGYKGNVSSRDNGHVGGKVGGVMVKKMIGDYLKAHQSTK